MFKLLRKSPQDLRIVRGPFKGARVFLNPANSTRKIFGLYEYCLNSWLAEVPKIKDFAFDVGSNTGYDLYGLAHLISQGNSKEATIIGFEPEAETFPELTVPREWAEYSNCKIEIIEKFAGSEETESATTLDRVFANHASLAGKSGLIKIDVEGAEVEVLRGAERLLDAREHDWLIEIHGAELIPTVCQFFVERRRPFLIKNLESLPLIGKEQREIDTYWLLTLQGGSDKF